MYGTVIDAIFTTLLLLNNALQSRGHTEGFLIHFGTHAVKSWRTYGPTDLLCSIRR